MDKRCLSLAASRSDQDPTNIFGKKEETNSKRANVNVDVDVEVVVAMIKLR